TRLNVIITEYEKKDNDTSNSQSDERQLNLDNVDTSSNTTNSPKLQQLNLDNVSLHGELSQMIQNIDEIDLDKIKPIEQDTNKNTAEQRDQEAENELKRLEKGKQLVVMIDKLIDFHYKELNKGKKEKILNQDIFDYFNITLHETYNWLLNNQNDSNSIYLFGY